MIDYTAMLLIAYSIITILCVTTITTTDDLLMVLVVKAYPGYLYPYTASHYYLTRLVIAVGLVAPVGLIRAHAYIRQHVVLAPSRVMRLRALWGFS